MPKSKTVDGVNMKELQVFLEQITNAYAQKCYEEN